MNDKEKSPIYELIAKLCKEKGTSPTALCIEITGSRGNLPTWQKGSINPNSLTKIADYFNVSTDYLLGRTDTPTTNTGNNISGNSNNGNNSISISSKPEEKNDSTTEEFIQVFKNMNLADRVAVMQFAFDKIRKGA